MLDSKPRVRRGAMGSDLVIETGAAAAIYASVGPQSQGVHRVRCKCIHGTHIVHLEKADSH